MGLRYTLRLFKGVDRTSMTSALQKTSEQLGGFIRWGDPGLGDQDFRLSTIGDIHTVYVPYQDNGFRFCEIVGRSLDIPWIELRIQEGSLWDYALYRGSSCVDTFSVCPQYWESGAAGEDYLKAWQGKPDILASLWGLNIEDISRYLVNWGYSESDEEGVFIFERTGKAYETDEFGYGEYEQYFDVLKRLGGAQPVREHTICLPNKH